MKVTIATADGWTAIYDEHGKRTYDDDATYFLFVGEVLRSLGVHVNELRLDHYEGELPQDLRDLI